jgi:hypothetical protein
MGTLINSPALRPNCDFRIMRRFRTAKCQTSAPVPGRAHRAVVPVLPESLLRPPVTADTGPACSSYDVNAAFRSFQLHERGIHAVWPGAGGAGWRTFVFTPACCLRRTLPCHGRLCY